MLSVNTHSLNKPGAKTLSLCIFFLIYKQIQLLYILKLDCVLILVEFQKYCNSQNKKHKITVKGYIEKL